MLESTQAMYTRMRDSINDGGAPRLFWILQFILGQFDQNWVSRQFNYERIIMMIQSEASEQSAAVAMWELTRQLLSGLASKLLERTALFYNHIELHITGDSVLDFGCGDGDIGTKVAGDNGKGVLLYDCTDYRRDRESTVPFTMEWSEVEERQFDTALVLTVLHHCEDPEAELARVAKIAKRIIVLESVLNDHMSWTEMAFVDWLYNRGFHPGADIPVPGNYRTVVQWQDTFQRLGLKVVKEKDLGVDLPIVPEWHHLFVLERT